MPACVSFALQQLSWPFDDPARIEGSPEIQLAKFRRVRDEIDEQLRAWLRELAVDI